MSDQLVWRYYGAVLASLISTIAWIGSVVGVLYLFYAVAVGGAVGEAGLFVFLAAVTGAAFAKLETRLYDVR